MYQCDLNLKNRTKYLVHIFKRWPARRGTISVESVLHTMNTIAVKNCRSPTVVSVKKITICKDVVPYLIVQRVGQNCNLFESVQKKTKI